MKKKIMALILAQSLVFGMSGPVLAESAEAADPAQALLEAVAGTYEPLFPVTNQPEYDQLWIDDCAAVVGEEAAEATAEILKNACYGDIYGEEAIEAYADENADVRFKCDFIEGVAQFTFDGNTISGTDADGNEVFRHEYIPAGEFSISGMLNGYLYETADADAGSFTYFLLMPDTPETTYHIEFRYGENKDDLAEYAEGPLAYWLAAGIPVDRDEQMVEDVIKLFCDENLAEEGGEAPAEETEVEAATPEDGAEAVEDAADDAA